MINATTRIVVLTVAATLAAGCTGTGSTSTGNDLPQPPEQTEGVVLRDTETVMPPPSAADLVPPPGGKYEEKQQLERDPRLKLDSFPPSPHE
jgi:hypothetical protein